MIFMQVISLSLVWAQPSEKSQVTSAAQSTPRKLTVTSVTSKEYDADMQGVVVFSPDGRTIATAGNEKVSLWNASTLDHVLSFSAYRQLVEWVVFSPDGKHLFGGSGSLERKITCWKINGDEIAEPKSDVYAFDS